MDRTRYKQGYGDFIGVDFSSDPSVVARNRLAYALNMWRDYESSRGNCIETFPGYRTAAKIGARINGIYSFKTKSGVDYLIVHAGRNLYAFTASELAAEGGFADPSLRLVLEGKLSDGKSTGYLFNNNLYILDGKQLFEVKVQVSEVGIETVEADEIVGYVPTTYFDSKPYEQRNMLSDFVYEVAQSEEQSEEQSEVLYEYQDSVGNANGNEIESRTVTASKNDGKRLDIVAPNLKVAIAQKAFNNRQGLKTVKIECKEFCYVQSRAFEQCKNLETVNIFVRDNIYINATEIKFEEDAFYGCDKLKNIYVYSDDPDLSINVPSGIYGKIERVDSPDDFIDRFVTVSELAEEVIEVVDRASDAALRETQYNVETTNRVIDGDNVQVVKQIRISGNAAPNGVKLKLKVFPTHFSAIKGADNFFEGNTDYKKTGHEALNGCTKCAVFDGRVFLTGNSELPNTVFYNQRNLTGASDPTYFGAYNYINDGTGNEPNVDMLATPSYLMVMKGENIFYHTPSDNTSSDDTVRNLMPRIYPSISGAAGIGSSGKTVPGTTACNFLDDPVFLSRGLKAVGKETLNLERTVTHRSSNVDRLLIRENLAGAALAEWKGYLIILVNGNVYMADSRVVSQHQDGSYQYEWFYLSGIGAWDAYFDQYRYCTQYPITSDGIRLADCEYKFGKLSEFLKIGKSGDKVDGEIVVDSAVGTNENGERRSVEIYTCGEYLVEQIDGELYGSGVFHGANKIAVVGEQLFFGTPNGYILCANTDMRDEDGIIPREAYSFNGVAYESGCATRLDDCGQMGLAKCTLPGTVVAEFKMMPGSKCHVRVSLNGRDFKDLTMKGITSSRFDFSGLDFSTFAFNENENNIAVLREITRDFVRKQYYIYSDGFKEPFGFCGLSYNYYVKGKIRF